MDYNKTSAMQSLTPAPSSLRVPSLDGLRAVSIALVVISHLFVQGDIMNFRQAYFSYLGELGVGIFFGISGYLITRLLLTEQEQTGRIAIGLFYIRRVLRIAPPFYFLLICLFILRALELVHFSTEEGVAAATFIWNYLPGASAWWVGHTWSLAIEEQFYLLWPLCLAFWNRNTIIWFARILIVSMPLIRWLTRVLLPELGDRIPWMLHTRADSLLFGCLLALGALQPMWRFLRKPAVLALGLVILFILSPYLRFRPGSMYLYSIGYFLEAISIVAWIHWAVYAPASWFGRMLNTSPFIVVGAWSYSIYLWQQFFMAEMFVWPFPFLFPWNLVGTLLAALFSYYLIERAFIPLRAYFATSRYGKVKLQKVLG